CLRPRTLPEGDVNFGEAVTFRAAVFYVSVDANNLPRDVRTELRNAGNQLLDVNALRQRIDAREIFLHEGFVHDGDVGAAGDVLLSYRASLVDSDPKGLEILWSHHVEASARALRGVVDTLARDFK